MKLMLLEEVLTVLTTKVCYKTRYTRYTTRTTVYLWKWSMVTMH